MANAPAMKLRKELTKETLTAVRLVSAVFTALEIRRCAGISALLTILLDELKLLEISEEAINAVGTAYVTAMKEVDGDFLHKMGIEDA